MCIMSKLCCVRFVGGLSSLVFWLEVQFYKQFCAVLTLLQVSLVVSLTHKYKIDALYLEIGRPGVHVNSSTEQSSDACAFLWVSFLMSFLSFLYLQFYTSYTSVPVLSTRNQLGHDPAWYCG